LQAVENCNTAENPEESAQADLVALKGMIGPIERLSNFHSDMEKSAPRTVTEFADLFKQSKAMTKSLQLSLVDTIDKEDIAKGAYCPNFELTNLGRLMEEVMILVHDLSLLK
jgi:hypothetical protein